MNKSTTKSSPSLGGMAVIDLTDSDDEDIFAPLVSAASSDIEDNSSSFIVDLTVSNDEETEEDSATKKRARENQDKADDSKNLTKNINPRSTISASTSSVAATAASFASSATEKQGREDQDTDHDAKDSKRPAKKNPPSIVSTLNSNSSSAKKKNPPSTVSTLNSTSSFAAAKQGQEDQDTGHDVDDANTPAKKKKKKKTPASEVWPIFAATAAPFASSGTEKQGREDQDTDHDAKDSKRPAKKSKKSIVRLAVENVLENFPAWKENSKLNRAEAKQFRREVRRDLLEGGLSPDEIDKVHGSVDSKQFKTAAHAAKGAVFVEKKKKKKSASTTATTKKRARGPPAKKKKKKKQGREDLDKDDGNNDCESKPPAKKKKPTPKPRGKQKGPLRLAVENVLENYPEWKGKALTEGEGEKFRREVRLDLLNRLELSDEMFESKFGKVDSATFRKKAHDTLSKCRPVVNAKQAQTKRRVKDPNAVVTKGDGHARLSQDREWTVEHQKSQKEANDAWLTKYKETHGVAYEKVRSEHRRENDEAYRDYQREYQQKYNPAWRRGEVGTPGAGPAFMKRYYDNQKELRRKKCEEFALLGFIGTIIGGTKVTVENCGDEDVAKLCIDHPLPELGGKSTLEVLLGTTIGDTTITAENCDNEEIIKLCINHPWPELEGRSTVQLLIGKTVGGLTITAENCGSGEVAEYCIDLPRKELGGKSIREATESGEYAAYIGTSYAALQDQVLAEYVRFLTADRTNISVVQRDRDYDRTSSNGDNNNIPRVIPYATHHTHFNLKRLTKDECEALGIFTIEIVNLKMPSMEEGLKLEQALQYRLNHLPFGTGKLHRKVGAGQSHSNLRNKAGRMTVFCTMLPPNFFKNNPDLVVVGEKFEESLE